MWSGVITENIPCKYLRIGVGYRIEMSESHIISGIILGYVTKAGVEGCNYSMSRYLIDSNDELLHPTHTDEKPCTICPYDDRRK